MTKILVAIANYGTKNAVHARRLIDEYQAMPFDVDIVMLSETSKGFESDVTELVGLPNRDPWSLPFGHRKLFLENMCRYDVFIYTEDDTLIREENIRAFLRASKILPENTLPGFVRYELYPDGSRNYPDIHGPYHWVPRSVRRYGDYVCADLSNDHSACYVLTQPQLQRAIRSGGFALSPHKGRYDLLCTAATDPYTQCGFSRLICLSHLPEFEVHHLSNAYLERSGLHEVDHRLQIDALFDILDKKCSDGELFVTEKPIAAQGWGRDYYEPCRSDLLQFIRPDSARILSVGCGSGDTEAYLIDRGMNVVAVPLDAVIGRLAHKRGVPVLPPDFEEAFEALGEERFDAILLPNVLQHVADPADLLSRLGRFLDAQGRLIGCVPNLGLLRRLLGRLIKRSDRWSTARGTFDDLTLHLTDGSMLKRWLIAGGLVPLSIRFNNIAAVSEVKDWRGRMPQSVTATDLVFSAVRSNLRSD